MKPPAPDKYVRRELDPVALEFYRRLADDGAPSTTRCEGCARTAFPPRLHCPACGAEQQWVELPREGTLYAFTTQERAMRFTAPVVFAVAELGEAMLPGVLDADYDTLEIGAHVRAFAREEPETGLSVVGFEPIR